MNDKLPSIDSYIQKIDYWLLYPKTKKKIVLDRLKAEIIEAIQDTEKKDPVEAFGNPYQVAKDVSLGQDWDIERSSYSDRIVAFMIDTFIQIIGILMGVFIWMRAVLSPNYFATGHIVTFALVTLFFFLIPYVLILDVGYFIIFEKITSKTPGKALLGLTVCDVSGVRITWSQAIIRNLTKVESTILLFEVIIGIAQKTDFQRPLDVLANTIVIRKRFRNPAGEHNANQHSNDQI
ncbi:MAG: RDD family protein [Promethearchaeota archaeon]